MKSILVKNLVSSRKVSSVVMGKLTGKVAIVTASTEGIGFAIAKKLANEGANVVVSSRKEANVNAAVASLKNYGYNNISGIVCHVGKSEDRKKLYEEAVNKFGGIDILVSNAAVNPFFGFAADCPEDSWDKIFEINVKCAFLLTKEVLPYLKQRNGGSIIYISSIAGLKPFQARSPSDKNEFLFKILVIGELGTGKTSIIKRYVHQFFSQHYRATIGVDFALKVLPWDSETTIRLQLWDIAGQERFGSMTRVYYKEAVGAFIVFDVTRESTFEAVTKWKQDLDAKVQLGEGEPIPCVLLANKCDQPKEGLVNNNNKMNEFCKENQFVAWFETSAKDNINIEEAANCLVAKIVQNNQKKQQEKEATNGTGVISIDNVDGNAPIKRKFCNAC